MRTIKAEYVLQYGMGRERPKTPVWECRALRTFDHGTSRSPWSMAAAETRVIPRQKSGSKRPRDCLTATGVTRDIRGHLSVGGVAREAYRWVVP